MQQVPGVLGILRKSVSITDFLVGLSAMPSLHIRLIERRTRKQSKSYAWFTYRRHVITASTTHYIYHSYLKKSTKFKPIALIASCINIPSAIPALKYGNEKEKVALAAYTQKCQKLDPLFKVQALGLVLDPSFPAFGGSPDGVGICGNGERYLIEIKCPFSFKDGNLLKDGAARLSYLDEEGNLRKTHQYYFQIQTLMGIMKLKRCMLVIWCPMSMIVLEIQANPEFYTKVREACIAYYKKTYLTHIFDKR